MSEMFAGFTEETIALPRGISLRVRQGGEGPPVLLLHGYPQTSACWHLVAPQLVAAGYRVIVPDLRGYGGSSKPASTPGHGTYSKREMAADQVALMRHLGHETFFLAGHDRGGRVTHRLALDHPDVLRKIAVLDIAPTATMYAQTDMAFATAYYHWFFLIQPAPLPETLLAADPAFYIQKKLGGLGRKGLSVFREAALAEYIHYFSDPDCISATCEDYRAAASIDLEHDREDQDSRITCPLLALWGGEGVVGNTYDVIAAWEEKALQVQGKALPCGHFLPEEVPDETAQALIDFFKAT